MIDEHANLVKKYEEKLNEPGITPELIENDFWRYLEAEKEIDTDFEKRIRDWISERLDNAITLSGQEFSKEKKGYILDQLMADMQNLWSTDGIFDRDDKKIVTDNLLAMANQWRQDLLDGVEEPDARYLEALLKKIMPTDKLADALEEMKNFSADGDVVSAITNSIEKLIANGFSYADIAGYIEKYGLESLNRSHIENIIWSMIIESFGGMDLARLFLQDGKWADGSSGVLSTMKNLLDSGVSAEQIREAYDNSDTIDAFAASLENLGKVSDSTGQSEETLAKTTKAYVSDIEKAQKIVNAINNGKTIDLSTLRELAEEHPALMLANDTKELKAALESLIQEDENGLISEWADKLLGSKDSVQAFLSTRDGETRSAFEAIIGEAETLKEALELTDDETFIDAAKEWAKQAATAFYNAKQKAEELKETVDAVTRVQNANSIINQTKEAIKALTEGKRLTQNDLLGLAKEHPEILAVIDDVKKLKEALNSIAEEETEKLKEAWGDIAKDGK